ncbi:MAG: SCO family protein [Elusimicrobiota bacterium]
MLAVLLAATASAQFQPPDEAHDLPDFSMTAVTAKSIRPLGKKNLLGRVWVADFFFTTCKGVCPMVTGRFMELQKRLPKEVLAVSFTIDPDNDKPGVLQTYAVAHAADPERWLFLTTSSQAAMIPLLRDGFATAYRKDSTAACGYRTEHSTKFVLVDATGRVVHMYASENPAEMDRLVREAAALIPARAIKRKKTAP